MSLQEIGLSSEGGDAGERSSLPISRVPAADCSEALKPVSRWENLVFSIMDPIVFCFIDFSIHIFFKIVIVDFLLAPRSN